MTAPQRAPTVAAVITYYCDDRFFAEALASVRAQTRLPDEIIVVDDASPADQRGVLDSLGEDVRIITMPRNGGAGAARQAGADAARAELIAYLDADDLWLPDKLLQQVTMLTADPAADAVHCALIMVRTGGRETVFLNKPAVLDLATELEKNQVLPSAMMIRRESLQSVGGWSADRRLMEDWDLNIRLVAAGRRIVFFAQPLVRFRRMGHGNLSSRGWTHLLILLQTIWHHRRLYRRTLGAKAALAVAGSVIRHEGFRRGRLSGGMLRTTAWILGAR